MHPGDEHFRVYEYIARRPDSTVKEIAVGLRRTEPSTHATVDRLRQAGLVTNNGDHRIRPTPGGPRLLFEHLRSEIEDEYNHKRKQATELQVQFTRVLDSAVLESARHEGAVTVLTSDMAVEKCLLDLAGHARRTVLSMWADDQISFDRIDAVIHSVASQRTLTVRSIFPSAVTPSLDDRRALNASVRSAAQPPLTLHLFDQRVAVVVANDTAAVVTREPALVLAMSALFEATWASSVDVPAGSSSDPSDLPLDREDVALLQLLSDGAKDEQVARTMGMSVRTVRRRVSSLLDSLDASSRFQAGALARSRGWI